jgi:hyperosmotically inducible protein
MKRKFRIILGASALASTLAVVPSVWAQRPASPDTASGTAVPNNAGVTAAPDTASGTAVKDQMTDAAITSKANSTLNQDKDTAPMASAIQVQTAGGVVTLTGNVPSKEAAEHAQMVVARLSGVRDVVNDLKYPADSTASSQSGPVVVPPQNNADGSTSMNAPSNMMAPSTNVANSTADPAVH